MAHWRRVAYPYAYQGERGTFAIRISNTFQPPGRHLKHRAALAGLALSAAIALGASPARALTVETLGNANPDGRPAFGFGTRPRTLSRAG